MTEGELGCTVYEKNREYRVPAFPAVEIDPTGAGDCFLAGFAAGLIKGYPLEKAVRLGNYFGSLAVGQVGVPKLDGNLPELGDYSLENDSLRAEVDVGIEFGVETEELIGQSIALQGESLLKFVT
jgi:bifunctional ADP-heptose synthase (sugar kinase/adenylyltransferase)